MAFRNVIHSKGIYHGLPDLSEAPNGLTAIVTGSNGMSGAHMVRVLAENPDRWSKVYALSRKPPSISTAGTVEHVSVDFLSDPHTISDILTKKDIKPDYIFFFSYILVTDESGALQWGNQKLVDQNNLLLENFLEALSLAQALPKRIFIQFGQKWYGLHLGASDIPDTEEDPRLQLEPNLYYTQQDILAAFCEKHDIGWNSALPSFLIGATPDSVQSLLFPILIFASVQKALGRPLEYPSDLTSWYAPQTLSSSILSSHMYEWCVLAANTKNQRFNISDDCPFTWGKFWPRLAQRFDMEYTGPQISRSTAHVELDMPAAVPPHGRGPRSVMLYKYSFVNWARRPGNIDAWKQLVAKHGLRSGEWKDAGSVFGRMDFCLDRPWPSIMSTTKAKKFGWFGFVDSSESILSVVDEFVALKIIPNPLDIQRTDHGE